MTLDNLDFNNPYNSIKRTLEKPKNNQNTRELNDNLFDMLNANTTDETKTNFTGEEMDLLESQLTEEKTEENKKVKKNTNEKVIDGEGKKEEIKDLEGDNLYKVSGKNNQVNFSGDKDANTYKLTGEDHEINIKNIGADDSVILEGEKEDWEIVDTEDHDENRDGHVVILKNKNTGTTVEISSDERNRTADWINDRITFNAGTRDEKEAETVPEEEAEKATTDIERDDEADDLLYSYGSDKKDGQSTRPFLNLSTGELSFGTEGLDDLNNKDVETEEDSIDRILNDYSLYDVDIQNEDNEED